MRTTLRSVLVTLVLATTAVAAPPPPVRMSVLVQKADLIVIGTLEDVRSDKEERWSNFSATLRIESSIFGEAPSSSVVRLQWYTGQFLCQGFWYLDTYAGQKAVWLLQRDTEGQYSFWHPNQIWFYHSNRYPSVEEATQELREEDGATGLPKIAYLLQAIGGN